MKDVIGFPLSFWLLSVICLAYYVAIFPFVSLGVPFFQKKFEFTQKNANFIARYFPQLPTLEFLINVPVRLLIFEQFSHQYALIRTSTFIFYEQLMILYTCTWPIFMRNYIFEAIILHQYAYLDQYVY